MCTAMAAGVRADARKALAVVLEKTDVDWNARKVCCCWFYGRMATISGMHADACKTLTMILQKSDIHAPNRRNVPTNLDTQQKKCPNLPGHSIEVIS